MPITLGAQKCETVVVDFDEVMTTAAYAQDEDVSRVVVGGEDSRTEEALRNTEVVYISQAHDRIAVFHSIKYSIVVPKIDLLKFCLETLSKNGVRVIDGSQRNAMRVIDLSSGEDPLLRVAKNVAFDKLFDSEDPEDPERTYLCHEDTEAVFHELNVRDLCDDKTPILDACKALPGYQGGPIALLDDHAEYRDACVAKDYVFSSVRRTTDETDLYFFADLLLTLGYDLAIAQLQAIAEDKSIAQRLLDSGVMERRRDFHRAVAEFSAALSSVEAQAAPALIEAAWTANIIDKKTLVRMLFESLNEETRKTIQHLSPEIKAEMTTLVINQLAAQDRKDIENMSDREAMNYLVVCGGPDKFLLALRRKNSSPRDISDRILGAIKTRVSAAFAEWKARVVQVAAPHGDDLFASALFVHLQKTLLLLSAAKETWGEEIGSNVRARLFDHYPDVEPAFYLCEKFDGVNFAVEGLTCERLHTLINEHGFSAGLRQFYSEVLFNFSPTFTQFLRSVTKTFTQFLRSVTKGGWIDYCNATVGSPTGSDTWTILLFQQSFTIVHDIFLKAVSPSMQESLTLLLHMGPSVDCSAEPAVEIQDTYTLVANEEVATVERKLKVDALNPENFHKFSSCAIAAWMPAKSDEISSFLICKTEEDRRYVVMDFLSKLSALSVAFHPNIQRESAARDPQQQRDILTAFVRFMKRVVGSSEFLVLLVADPNICNRDKTATLSALPDDIWLEPGEVWSAADKSKFAKAFLAGVQKAEQKNKSYVSLLKIAQTVLRDAPIGVAPAEAETTVRSAYEQSSHVSLVKVLYRDLTHYRERTAALTELGIKPGTLARVSTEIDLIQKEQGLPHRDSTSWAATGLIRDIPAIYVLLRMKQAFDSECEFPENPESKDDGERADYRLREIVNEQFAAWDAENAAALQTDGHVDRPQLETARLGRAEALLTEICANAEFIAVIQRLNFPRFIPLIYRLVSTHYLAQGASLQPTSTTLRIVLMSEEGLEKFNALKEVEGNNQKIDFILEGDKELQCAHESASAREGSRLSTAVILFRIRQTIDERYSFSLRVIPEKTTERNPDEEPALILWQAFSGIDGVWVTDENGSQYKIELNAEKLLNEICQDPENIKLILRFSQDAVLQQVLIPIGVDLAAQTVGSQFTWQRLLTKVNVQGYYSGFKEFYMELLIAARSVLAVETDENYQMMTNAFYERFLATIPFRQLRERLSEFFGEDDFDLLAMVTEAEAEPSSAEESTDHAVTKIINKKAKLFTGWVLEKIIYIKTHGTLIEREEVINGVRKVKKFLATGKDAIELRETEGINLKIGKFEISLYSGSSDLVKVAQSEIKYALSPAIEIPVAERINICQQFLSIAEFFNAENRRSVIIDFKMLDEQLTLYLPEYASTVRDLKYTTSATSVAARKASAGVTAANIRKVVAEEKSDDPIATAIIQSITEAFNKCPKPELDATEEAITAAKEAAEAHMSLCIKQICAQRENVELILRASHVEPEPRHAVVVHGVDDQDVEDAEEVEQQREEQIRRENFSHLLLCDRVVDEYLQSLSMTQAEQVAKPLTAIHLKVLQRIAEVNAFFALGQYPSALNTRILFLPDGMNGLPRCVIPSAMEIVREEMGVKQYAENVRKYGLLKGFYRYLLTTIGVTNTLLKQVFPSSDKDITRHMLSSFRHHCREVKNYSDEELKIAFVRDLLTAYQLSPDEDKETNKNRSFLLQFIQTFLSLKPGPLKEKIQSLLLGESLTDIQLMDALEFLQSSYSYFCECAGPAFKNILLDKVENQESLDFFVKLENEQDSMAFLHILGILAENMTRNGEVISTFFGMIPAEHRGQPEVKLMLEQLDIMRDPAQEPTPGLIRSWMILALEQQGEYAALVDALKNQREEFNNILTHHVFNSKENTAKILSHIVNYYQDTPRYIFFIFDALFSADQTPGKQRDKQNYMLRFLREHRELDPGHHVSRFVLENYYRVLEKDRSESTGAEACQLKVTARLARVNALLPFAHDKWKTRGVEGFLDEYDEKGEKNRRLIDKAPENTFVSFAGQVRTRFRESKDDGYSEKLKKACDEAKKQANLLYQPFLDAKPDDGSDVRRRDPKMYERHLEQLCTDLKAQCGESKHDSMQQQLYRATFKAIGPAISRQEETLARVLPTALVNSLTKDHEFVCNEYVKQLINLAVMVGSDEVTAVATCLPCVTPEEYQRLYRQIITFERENTIQDGGSDLDLEQRQRLTDLQKNILRELNVRNTFNILWKLKVEIESLYPEVLDYDFNGASMIPTSARRDAYLIWKATETVLNDPASKEQDREELLECAATRLKKSSFQSIHNHEQERTVLRETLQPYYKPTYSKLSSEQARIRLHMLADLPFRLPRAHRRRFRRIGFLIGAILGIVIGCVLAFVGAIGAVPTGGAGFIATAAGITLIKASIVLGCTAVSMAAGATIGEQRGKYKEQHFVKSYPYVPQAPDGLLRATSALEEERVAANSAKPLIEKLKTQVRVRTEQAITNDLAAVIAFWNLLNKKDKGAAVGVLSHFKGQEEALINAMQEVVQEHSDDVALNEDNIQLMQDPIVEVVASRKLRVDADANETKLEITLKPITLQEAVGEKKKAALRGRVMSIQSRAAFFHGASPIAASVDAVQPERSGSFHSTHSRGAGGVADDRSVHSVHSIREESAVRNAGLDAV